MQNFNFSASFLTLALVLCSQLIATCNGQVITLEQYDRREGEDFCRIRSKSDHTLICQWIAQANSIEGYVEERLQAYCSPVQLNLVKEDGSEAPRRQEDLLHCLYVGPPKWDATKNTYIEGFKYLRGIGRGINKNDVIEYTFNGSRGVPNANHINLLTAISGKK